MSASPLRSSQVVFCRGTEGYGNTEVICHGENTSPEPSGNFCISASQANPTAFNTSLAIKDVLFIHSASSSSSWRNGQMLPTACCCDAPALTSSLAIFTAWPHQRSISVRSTTFYSLAIYKNHPPSCSRAFMSNTPECIGFVSLPVFTPPQSQSHDLAAWQSQDRENVLTLSAGEEAGGGGSHPGPPRTPGAE